MQKLPKEISKLFKGEKDVLIHERSSKVLYSESKNKSMSGLCFEVAVQKAINSSSRAKFRAFTIPEWSGFHFIIDNVYYIYLSNHSIIKNPSRVYSVNEHEWMMVNPNKEARDNIFKLLNKKI